MKSQMGSIGNSMKILGNKFEIKIADVDGSFFQGVLP